MVLAFKLWQNINKSIINFKHSRNKKKDCGQNKNRIQRLIYSFACNMQLASALKGANVVINQIFQDFLSIRIPQ